MSFAKQISLSLALVCALAAPAMAQGIPQALTNLREGMVLMVTPAGKVMTMHMTSKAMSDTMMTEGTKMTSGMMIVMRGGQLFLVPDKKMSDGKTLSETMERQ